MSAKKIITREEVVGLAKLANLELSEDEIQRHTTEIARLLKYFQQLDELDLEGVQPTISVNPQHSVMRDDKVTDQLAQPDDLLDILPRQKDRYIQVERMI